MTGTEGSASAAVEGACTGEQTQPGASGESPASAATIPVSGMTCAGCADNVQLALSQVRDVGTVV